MRCGSSSPPRSVRRPRVVRAQFMRAMFVIYIVLIAAGLVTFTIIGLTHH